MNVWTTTVCGLQKAAQGVAFDYTRNKKSPPTRSQGAF